MRIGGFTFYNKNHFNSGRPARLVKTDSTPDKIDADNTYIQSTSPNTAEVPIVANADCETVLIALMLAALIHFINLSFSISHLKISQAFLF